MTIVIGELEQARPAIFLDRDGTLIESTPYLGDPAAVQLVKGAANALVAARSAGFACVLITNQSGVGRGLISLACLEEIHRELIRKIEIEGASLDGIYFCTAVPSSNDLTVVEHPDRKPGPGLILRAANDLGLEIKRSWMIGDMISDVLAGINASCEGCVWIGASEADLMSVARFSKNSLVLRAASIESAVEMILENRQNHSDPTTLSELC